jgi:hypothetical protein
VDDSGRYGIPSTWLNFLLNVPHITEGEQFQSQLRKLDPTLQRAWTRTKDRLHHAITPGADFKKWPPGGHDCYSVRINDGYRAHLRRRGHDDWLAVAIGSHSQMGHG